MNLGEWIRRIWYLLNRRRFEAELSREMEAHREMLSETPGEQPPFGNTLHLREQSRDVWGWHWLDTAWQDLRYARRTLNPGFAITAGLILSLGIGLNLTFFQIVNVTLLEPLPVKNPHTLVNFYRVTKHSTSNGVHWEEADFVRRNNRVLSAVLIQSGGNDMAWGEEAADRLSVDFVSANWFDELGFGAASGRVLHPEVDEKPGSPPVIVISHEFWHTRLGGDPAVVGKTVRLNNRPATVVGVASTNFPNMRRGSFHAWAPFTQMDYFFPGTDHKATGVHMYGRLRPGISPAAARDGLKVSMAEIGRKRSTAIEGDPWLEPYLATSRFRDPKENQQMWTILGLVVGLTLLVLVVACSNVGNLVLSRAIGRTREFSVRMALGASRWRIMRQLLMECLLLACLGALGGLVLAAWGSRTFAALTELPAYLDFTPDARLVLAATAAALLSMLATGLAPAWRISRQDLTAAMKDGGQQTSGGLERTRLRKLLVASQVAACCLLLVIAGLMIRGLQRLLSADRGFDFYNVATLEPSLSSYGMKAESARAWWKSVRRAVAFHPETESLAIVSTAPLSGGLNTTIYNDAPRIKITRIDVEPGFFALMKIPIVVGRDFVPSDDYRSTVIISRRVAMEMYGTLDVLGKSFPKSITKERAGIIVGVTGDAHMLKITATDLGEMYSPLNPEGYANYQLIARARTDPELLTGPMRRAARAADDRVLAQATLMRAEFDEKLRVPRLASSIAGIMGLLALTLACLGIYGVVAFSAALRTKEIGIRMALGATRPTVVRMLVRHQAWPLLLGLVIGIAGAVPTGRVLQGEPFYLNPTDPLVQSAVILVFVLTGGIATVVPGLRALRLDPVRALRHD